MQGRGNFFLRDGQLKKKESDSRLIDLLKPTLTEHDLFSVYRLFYDISKTTSKKYLNFTNLNQLFSNTITRCKVQYDIKGVYRFLDLLEKTEPQKRLKLANSNAHNIPNLSKLIAVIQLLPDEDQLIFTKQHLDKVVNVADMIRIARVMFLLNRDGLFRIFQDMILDFPVDLFGCLKVFPRSDHGLIMAFFAGKVQRSNDLFALLDEAPAEMKLEIAFYFHFHIKTFFDLSTVLKELSANEQLDFLFTAYTCRVTTLDNLCELLKAVPEQQQYKFAANYMRLIKTVADLMAVTSRFILPTHRSRFQQHWYSEMSQPASAPSPPSSSEEFHNIDLGPSVKTREYARVLPQKKM